MPLWLRPPLALGSPAAGHGHDLREGQLHQDLLLLIHEVHTCPVDSHDDIILGEAGAWVEMLVLRTGPHFQPLFSALTRRKQWGLEHKEGLEQKRGTAQCLWEDREAA